MVSKSPVDPRKLKLTTAHHYFKFVDMTELPWTPIYTQQQRQRDGDDDSVMYIYAMAGTILFTVLVFLLERILDERQAHAYQKTEFPSDLSLTVSKIDSAKAATATSKDSLDTTDSKNTTTEESTTTTEKNPIDTHKPILPQLQEKFNKAQHYGRDKIQFGMFSSSYDLMESISFLMLGYLPYCWDLSVRLGGQYMGWKDETQNEIKITLIFLAITTAVSTITSLPFELVRLGYLHDFDSFAWLEANFYFPLVVISIQPFGLRKSMGSTSKHLAYFSRIKSNPYS